MSSGIALRDGSCGDGGIHSQTYRSIKGAAARRSAGILAFPSFQPVNGWTDWQPSLN